MARFEEITEKGIRVSWRWDKDFRSYVTTFADEEGRSMTRFLDHEWSDCGESFQKFYLSDVEYVFSGMKATGTKKGQVPIEDWPSTDL
mgnify:CR=1 FL=1|tara:strand:- start:1356 stop:1619 length:264 start_codon:yes stop_codon:yes gene_type:complete